MGFDPISLTVEALTASSAATAATTAASAVGATAAMGTAATAATAASTAATAAAMGSWSAVVGVGSAMMSASASNKASEYNAKAAEQEAQSAVEVGQRKEAQQRYNTGDTVAGQRVAYATAGVNPDTGSAAQIQAETREFGESDALTIRANALQKQQPYLTQSNAYRAGKQNVLASGVVSGLSSAAQTEYYKKMGIV